MACQVHVVTNTLTDNTNSSLGTEYCVSVLYGQEHTCINNNVLITHAVHVKASAFYLHPEERERKEKLVTCQENCN